MALKGDLSEFTVEHVLRLLALSGQTGTLDVRAAGAKTSIDVTGGSVSNVRRTDDPEVALGRALLAREGTFTFTAGETGERAIEAPLDELIERSRERATEATLIETAIPDEDVRFRLSDRATSGGAFTVAPDELKVLMEVGGGRSVREIRERARTPTSRAAALLYGLLQKGLIERTESEAAVAVQVTGPAAARRRRPRPPAEPPAATGPPIEVAPAPAAVAPPPEVEAPDLTDELDVRLAAIAEASAPSTEPQPQEDVIVVTPSVAPAAPSAEAAAPAEATVVFALHYMPPTAQPVEPAAPPKRRGLFDFVLRRSSTGAAAQPEIDVPSPAELASLANALYAEYKRAAEARTQLGPFAEGSARVFDEALAARLARVYSMRAIGSRVPLRGDAIDVDAIRSGDIAPARILPYLALLVRDLRDEAIRAFGAEDARATYTATATRVFGREVETPTMILRRAELPPRGRLRRQDGRGAPVELRDRTYFIGRAAASDVVVPDEKVSSRHAQLTPDVTGFRLRDLGSTNGTFVDGERIAGDRLLRGGEAIRVGDTTFVYERLSGS